MVRKPRRDGGFDQAIAESVAAYAARNERDHRALVHSIADGKIAAVEGSSDWKLPPVVI